MEDKMAY